MTAALVAASTSAAAQLNPGDVVVIGVHGDGSSNAAVDGDAFSWVPLVDLPANTILYFSDVGYFTFKAANNGFGSDDGEEGLFRFTVPAGGITAGTVMTVNPMNVTPAEYTLVSGNAYTPDLAQDWINLSDGGDQLVVFQDDDVSNTLNFNGIFAVTSSTTDWAAAIDGDLIDPNNGGTGSESNLFPGLIDLQTAVAVGAGVGSLTEFDNVRYIGTTSGTRSALLAAVANPANWEGTDASQSVSNGGPGSAIWSRNGVTQFTVDPGSGFPEFCTGDGGDQLGCTNCPCGNNAAMGSGGGCLNSNASSARLVPSGNPDVTLPADTLHFNVLGANVMTFGILTSGDNRLPNNPGNICFTQNPGSGVQSPGILDGLRCIGGGVIRHGSRSSDANGDIGVTTNGWGPPNNPMAGIGVTSGFIAGQTRHFQVFYREDAMAVCLTGQNTTQGVSVTFL